MVLSDEQLAEIEQRANATTAGPWTLYTGGAIAAGQERHCVAKVEFPQLPDSMADGRFIAHAREDIPALCATVKHLRAENDEYERRWRNQTQRNHTLSQNNRELQSQLEQLRAENERLLRGDFTDEELQGFCHNLSEQDRDAFFEGCTKYQERLFGTSAIAQLKENQ